MKRTVTMKPVLDEATTDGEKAAVTTVVAIDEMPKALLDGTRALGEEPEIEQSDGQRQARKTLKML